MFALKNNHPFWWAAAEVLIYLLLFSAIVSVMVFLLRGPMRQYKPADMRIFSKLERWRTPINNRLMLALTFLAKHQFLIPVNLLLIAAFVFFGKDYWNAFRVLVMALSSLSLMFILKHMFRRKRPAEPLLFEAKGKSFPSGHAIMAVNFYGLMLNLMWNTEIDLSYKITASVMIIFLIIMIGLSRVYLQVHYTSDVLAGYIIGCCWFYTGIHILNQLEIMLNV